MSIDLRKKSDMNPPTHTPPSAEELYEQYMDRVIHENTDPDKLYEKHIDNQIEGAEQAMIEKAEELANSLNNFS